IILSLRSNSNQVGVLVVFAQHDISPWSYGKVIAVLQNLPIIGLRKQLQFTGIGFFPSLAFLLAGDVPKDLSRSDFAPIGTGKIQLFVTKPDALSSCENGSPLVKTLISQIIFRGFYIFNINPCNVDRSIDRKFRSFLVFPVSRIPAFFY